jgi:hypothetical protein
MNNRSNQERMERMQERIDSGFLSKHYPEVESIVISMIYNQRGIGKPIHRIVNFSPGSYAFFKINCLSRGCDDGGFDLSHIINGMVRNHRESAKGKLTCESDRLPVNHSDIEYDILMKFI